MWINNKGWLKERADSIESALCIVNPRHIERIFYDDKGNLCISTDLKVPPYLSNEPLAIYECEGKESIITNGKDLGFLHLKAINVGGRAHIILRRSHEN
jgi:hypothetical protein